MIRNSSAALGRAASSLGEQFTWKPLDKGRSAHDQVIEVAGMFLLAKHLVESGEMPSIDREHHARMLQKFDTAEKALKQLEDAADLLAIAIETAPTEQLAKVVRLPFGGGMDKTIAEVLLLAYWNNVYHEGQVNYIHTLAAE